MVSGFGEDSKVVVWLVAERERDKATACSLRP